MLRLRNFSVGSALAQNIGQINPPATLDITLNGQNIKTQAGTMTSISDVAAAINAQYNKTGVRAEISEGNKLTLINRNNSGTTEETKTST